jgi:hypothetical protein
LKGLTGHQLLSTRGTSIAETVRLAALCKSARRLID